MASNMFEDNSSLYDVNLNRFTRPQEPTANEAIKKASVRLAVLYELAYKGLSSYSDQAAFNAYRELADELMVSNGYVSADGKLTFQTNDDGTATIVRSSEVMSKSLKGK